MFKSESHLRPANKWAQFDDQQLRRILSRLEGIPEKTIKDANLMRVSLIAAIESNEIRRKNQNKETPL